MDDFPFSPACLCSLARRSPQTWRNCMISGQRGVSNRGISRFGLLRPGLFFLSFLGFSLDFGTVQLLRVFFLICLFDSYWPFRKRICKEHSRNGSGHNQYLSPKIWETPPVWETLWFVQPPGSPSPPTKVPKEVPTKVPT